jgi:hypothetical protein
MPPPHMQSNKSTAQHLPCPCCIMDTSLVTLVASFSLRRCLTWPDRCRSVPARLTPV